PGNADQVVFPAGASHQSNVNDLVNLSLQSITFGGDGYRIGGNPLAVTDVIGVMNLAGSNTVALAVRNARPDAAPLHLGGASYTTLTFAGEVDVGASGIVVDSVEGNVSFTGGLSGSGAVTVNAGYVTFAGLGSYAGGTYLNQVEVARRRGITVAT